MGIKEERGEVWRADRVQGPWRESAHEPTVVTVAGIYVKWDTNLQTPEQAATAPKPSPEEKPKSASKASLSSGRSMYLSARSADLWATLYSSTRCVGSVPLRIVAQRRVHATSDLL
jgi:hypothetical protein